MNTKIVCCYHRNSPMIFLPTVEKYPDIFVPILGGSVHGVPDHLFFQNMQHDDCGDNISYLNPQISEHSCIYWMYKHYQELGNPDMIGLCHYRRFFDLDYNNLDPKMLYLKRGKNNHSEWPRSVLHSFIGIPCTQLIIDSIIYDQPDFKDDIDMVLDDYDFFDKDMFIVPRHVFFGYMRYMMRCYRVLFSSQLKIIILRWAVDHPCYDLGTIIYRRGMSYVLEFLTAVFFTHLQRFGYPIHLSELTEDSFHDY